MSPTKRTKTTKKTKMSTKTATASKKKYSGLTDEERAAMKERVQELKAEARGGSRANKADGERDVLAKIAAMTGSDRAMAKRIHEIVTESAPDLTPKTWYGMPDMPKTATSSSSSKAAEVQDAVRDVRLQRQGEPRRRRHVADRLRADAANGCCRCKDRGAGKELGLSPQPRSRRTKLAGDLTGPSSLCHQGFDSLEALEELGHRHAGEHGSADAEAEEQERTRASTRLAG